MVEVIEYVHQFLVGTVLYITAIGFYQLFIHQIDYPDWLRWLHIDNTEELENNLIGVTVVVLAINFMSLVYVDDVRESPAIWRRHRAPYRGSRLFHRHAHVVRLARPPSQRRFREGRFLA